ncbi:hypothetical protein HYDPIDRAFT_118768 [Hydnomerulius pinastri MD-312]|uniref:Fungal-type protein kinase domain-containing protein n=1 Tax=Hydnomerulius pinastri MD-312 TaxID=994086 RepID=A0A0C9W079_9AGAM|nr:hypothetical protein HYDPIDRAFT_118768 [Hydnomerulius pinastri MD-312]
MDVNKELAKETDGRYVGPMPVQSFLDKYLPSSKEPCAVVLDKELLGKVASPEGSESSMYEPFKAAIEGCVPDMEVVDSSKNTNGARIGAFDLKPDICLYAAGVERTGATDFSAMELWIEFKAHTKFEPFDDPKEAHVIKSQKTLKDYSAGHRFEKLTQDAIRTRGQLTAYSLAQIGSQFRQFAFSVLIVKDHARFLRWDRAGAIVTAQFNYVNNSELLAEFFCRFSRLSPGQRGHDMSVSPKLGVVNEPRIRDALGLDSETPLFKWTVPDGAKEREYYGPRPPCPSQSLIGRSTRSLPVYDMVADRVVYLKDTWRINAPDVTPEGEVYGILHKKAVPNIAPFECGGDVGGDGFETKTQEETVEDWSCAQEAITGHIHYRMVLGVVGRSLTAFSSTKELAKGMLDAVEAHWHAYEDARILHRDISAGNILLTDEGGLLIDWDLCKSRDYHTRRRRDRTGTWEFMSAALLQNTHKDHELQDDLESFLHVLNWAMVRYVPSDLTPDTRRNYLLDMFGMARPQDGTVVGGRVKLSALRGEVYAPRCRLTKPSRLLALIVALSKPFAARYANVPSPFDAQDTSVPGDEWDRHVEDLLAQRDEKRLQYLKTSHWFISVMTQTIGEKTGWPTDDKADGKLLPTSDGFSTSRQQAVNASRMESQEIGQTSSKYPSSSYSAKRDRSPSASAEARGKRARGDTPFASGNHS